MTPTDRVDEIVQALRPRDLMDQFTEAALSHWLVQQADDDDRVDDDDRESMALRIPHTVRVRRHATSADLVATRARRERIDFLSRVCR